MEAEEHGGEDGHDEDVDVDTIDEDPEQAPQEEEDEGKAPPAAEQRQPTLAQTQVNALPRLSVDMPSQKHSSCCCVYCHRMLSNRFPDPTEVTRAPPMRTFLLQHSVPVSSPLTAVLDCHTGQSSG